METDMGSDDKKVPHPVGIIARGRTQATPSYPLSPHDSRRRSWRLLLASAAVFSLLQVCQPGAVTAQVLNQQVDQRLAGNCIFLLGPGVNAAVLGQNLQNLCSFQPTGAGGPPLSGSNSDGGGAASLLRICRIDLEPNLARQARGVENRRSLKRGGWTAITYRPYSSLGHLTPSEFVTQRQEDREAEEALSSG
jgi:hypothetical protein